MIFTADWHIRGDVPRCRMETEEEWLEHQRSVIRFIVKTANDRNEALGIVGDIFHTPVVSQKAFNMVLSELLDLKHGAYIMAGNHDMYKRTLDLGNTSYEALSIWASKDMFISNLDSLIQVAQYGDTEKKTWEKDVPVIAVHECCFPAEASIPPGAEAVLPQELLGRYKGFNVIVVGDQHHPFHHKHGARSVVNCGCITKQSGAFKDVDLFIWDINLETYEIEQIPLPADVGVVSDSHIVAADERAERLGAFVEKLKSVEASADSLDFRARLLADDRKATLTTTARNLLQEYVEQSYETA